MAPALAPCSDPSRCAASNQLGHDTAASFSAAPTASTVDNHVHLIMPSLVPVALSAGVTASEHVEMIMAVHAGTPELEDNVQTLICLDRTR